MHVSLHSLSGPFDNAVVSTTASSVDTCHVTYAASLPVILARLFIFPVASG